MILHQEVACLTCAGDVKIVNTAEPRQQETKVIVECVKCERQWLYMSTLEPVTRSPEEIRQRKYHTERRKNELGLAS